MDDETTTRVVNKIFRGTGLQLPPTPVRPPVSIPLPPPSYRKPAAAVVAAAKPKSFGARFMFAVARFIFKLSGTPFWEKKLTTLFYGPRSQGKSLHQAKTVRDILAYLDALYRFYPDLPQAIVVSNQKFNAEIEKKYLGTRLFYWESIQQLKHCMRPNCWKAEFEIKGLKKKEIKHRLHDGYIIIDDAATIIPADGWQDLPQWFRKLWAQAGHNGLHCIANIQDPQSCDINFRRYTDLCFKFTKIMGNRRPEATKPYVGWIWGIYTSREIPAEELWNHGDKSEQEIEQERADREAEESIARETGRKIIRVANNNWKKRYHLIRRRDTEIYDTLQNVPEWMPNSLAHYELKCIDPKCDHVTIRHKVI